MHTLKGKHADRGPRGKSTEAQDITCHSCYMKLLGGGLPKGYEGCTSVKEIASRKKAFESQPLQMLTARGLIGQSWKSPKTTSTNSRLFSTFRAAWNTPNDKPNIEESPTQNSRTQSSATLEANMLEAKRQYQVARRTWELAQGTDSQAQEKSAADKHRAWLQCRRTTYAWKMVSDTEYMIKLLNRVRESKQRPMNLIARLRNGQRPEVRAKAIARLRSARVNDPVTRARVLVYNWITHYPMARKMVEWTLFQPIKYSQKVKHHCHRCRYIRFDGLDSGGDLYLIQMCISVKCASSGAQTQGCQRLIKTALPSKS
jgi:hypothetical protein